MKLTISKEAILPALTHTAGVTAKKSAVPVMTNLLMEAGDGLLKITGGDLDTSMAATVECDVTEGGAITVPARKLLDIGKAAESGADIKMSLGDKLTVRSGKSRFTLATLPADQYPARSESEGQAIAVPAQALKDMIGAVAFAMAQQDVRYYLNGMLLTIADGEMSLVATDGHRLAANSAPIDAEDATCIIPCDAVMAMGKLLSSTHGDAQLVVSRHSLSVTAGDYTMIAKLIDGKFPDWQKVMPANNGLTVTANADAIRGAMSRAAILSNEKHKGVRMTVADNAATIRATNPEQEEAEEVVDVDYSGKEMEIGFNVSYMLDALSAIESENCLICLKDGATAALVLPDNDSSAKYVVMPMRL